MCAPLRRVSCSAPRFLWSPVPIIKRIRTADSPRHGPRFTPTRRAVMNHMKGKPMPKPTTKGKPGGTKKGC